MKYRIKDTDSDNEKETNKIINKKSGVNTNIEICNTQDISNINNNYKFINTLSSRLKTKNDLEEETFLYEDIEKILNKIKTEDNKDFIDSYKNNIIQVLFDMDENEQKLFLNSNHMMKKLIKKMKKGIVKNEINN